MKLFSRRASDSSSSSEMQSQQQQQQLHHSGGPSSSSASSGATSDGHLRSDQSSGEKIRSKSPSPTPRRPMRRFSLAPNITTSSSSSMTSAPPRRRLSRINFLSRHTTNDTAAAAASSCDNSQLNHAMQQINKMNLNASSSSPSKSKFTEKYKLVVLGGPKVGKTAIIQRFLYDKFPEMHAATVEELHHAEYNVKGLGTVAVDILDTSGSFEFPAMRRLAISGGHAFMLVYSIDDKDSFDEIIRLRELIMEVKNASNSSNNASGNTGHATFSSSSSSSRGGNASSTCLFDASNCIDETSDCESSGNDAPPIVIVANKSDLNDSRQVSKELAECECIDWDVAFVEASAKDNDKILSIFHKLLLQAHLKGVLKGISAAVNAGNTLVVEPKRERRRSSLPVNELFHHHLSKLSHRSPTSPDPKRNSCALS